MKDYGFFSSIKENQIQKKGEYLYDLGKGLIFFGIVGSILLVLTLWIGSIVEGSNAILRLLTFNVPDKYGFALIFVGISYFSILISIPGIPMYLHGLHLYALGTIVNKMDSDTNIKRTNTGDNTNKRGANNTTKKSKITINDNEDAKESPNSASSQRYTDPIVPNDTRIIPSKAFMSNTSIKTVVLPPRITEIQSEAFADCTELKHITLPEALKQIDSCAFAGCSSLENIIIPDNVTNIGTFAFWDCSKLESITVGNGVKEICANTFYQCPNLTSITIGSKTKLIGPNALAECPSLKSITFNGTISKWNSIEKHTTWDQDTGNYTVFCDDGEIANGENIYYE